MENVHTNKKNLKSQDTRLSAFNRDETTGDNGSFMETASENRHKSGTKHK